VTFKATDSGSPAQATANLTLTIGSVLTITTTSLPNGAVGTAYSQTLASTGGTGAVAWQLTSGTLPRWIDAECILGSDQRDPTATASATPVTFKVTDSGTPAQTATNEPDLDHLPVDDYHDIAPEWRGRHAVLPDTGGDRRRRCGYVAVTSGTLPAGLTLNASSGLISGTPTATASATPLTFKANDSGSPAQTTANLTLTIVSQLTITTTSLPNGAVGTAYSQTLASTGGTGAVTWQLTSGTLPAGLTLMPPRV